MPLLQQNSVFIDPESCGSSVGYYLHTTDYTDKAGKTTYDIAATVVLADCSHKIDWSFGKDDVQKIDAAIGMLQEFRKKYVQVSKMVENLNK